MTDDAHLCFICVDGDVVKRRDVFACRVFCGKEKCIFFFFFFRTALWGDPFMKLYNYLLMQPSLNRNIYEAIITQCREIKHKTGPLRAPCLLKNTRYSWVFGLPLSSVVKLMSVVGVELVLGGLCTDSGGLRSYWVSGSHGERGSRHAHLFELEG